MKAVSVLAYGGPLVFNDVPTPTIASDEILVKIRSTASTVTSHVSVGLDDSEQFDKPGAQESRPEASS